MADETDRQIPETPTGFEEILGQIEAVLTGAAVCKIPQSINALAATLDVKHVPEHGVFSVSSGNGHVNTVRLFPTESCTCPATVTCCHILAARSSIGLITETRKTLNLTRLRRNSR